MRTFSLALLLTVCLLSSPCLAQTTMTYAVSDTEAYTYERPSGVPFVTNFFKDFKLLYDNNADYEHVPWFLGIAASTALSIHYDEDLILGSQNLGRKWGISSQDKTKTFFKLFDLNFRFPTDLGSWMYFIGDGWTHGSIALGFLGFGYFANDYRAWATSYALFEGLFTTGTTTQVLKHLTGRESPLVRTQERGRWDFFPNQVKYHKNIPAHDAFPSGHLATGTMTLTVIVENYPEYRYFILPVGIGLLSALSFQMMNNGVHWFSDYPLAVAIGYGLAKVAVSNYRTLQQKRVTNRSLRRPEATVLFNPILAHQTYGLGVTVIF